MDDAELTPPKRSSISGSFKSNKGFSGSFKSKKGPQTSAPVDVVFDTFEVFVPVFFEDSRVSVRVLCV
jgi:hypothetical protein